jgi:hypothetical protein
LQVFYVQLELFENKISLLSKFTNRKKPNQTDVGRGFYQSDGIMYARYLNIVDYLPWVGVVVAVIDCFLYYRHLYRYVHAFEGYSIDRESLHDHPPGVIMMIMMMMMVMLMMIMMMMIIMMMILMTDDRWCSPKQITTERATKSILYIHIRGNIQTRP